MINYKGVKAFGGSYWIATVTVDGREYNLGKYISMDEAAIAYDMEILRAYGIDENYLNFSYKIIEKDENNRLKLLDSRGVEFVVDVCPDLQSYEPSSPPELRMYEPAPIPSIPLLSEGAPPRSSLIRPWLTRVTTSYTPGTSFCYEITFPEQNPLGLSLKPKSIYYSSYGMNKYMGTLVVEESQTLLSTIVYPGDILLRINQTNLTNFGDDFDFEAATNIISSINGPRIVRFLRPLGPDHTLSPAEVACFLSLPSSSICQCSIPNEEKEELIQTLGNEEEKSEKVFSEPTAKFNVVVNTGNSSLSLHQLSCDSQAPPQVKKCMQGQKVCWEAPPAASNPPLPSPYAGKVGIKSEIFYEDAVTKFKRDVYRESVSPASVSSVATTNSHSLGGKWVAQLIVPLSLVMKNKRSILSAFEEADETPKEFKRVFLGRYDYEEEANTVVKVAKQEWNSTGTFIPRRILPPSKPGTYVSQSNQSHGTSQSYSQQGSMRSSQPQYNASAAPPQGKVYNPDPKLHPTTTQTPVQSQRSQSMQSMASLPQQSTSQYGYYQSYLPPRGTPQATQQQSSQMTTYLSAPPRSHLSYPSQRSNEASSYPAQNIPSYSSSPHHLYRSNTSPNYPTEPSSVLPSPDGQMMYLTPTTSAPRGAAAGMYPNSSSGLPPQLPSLPRQLP